MPWKQVRHSAFRFPTRQELLIIAAASIICVIVVAYFALRP